MASLRLNGAALACFVQSGVESDLWHLSLSGPFRGDQFGAFWRTAMDEDHVGMLGVNLVEAIPDQVVVVEVETAGKRDLRPCRQHDLGLGAALGCDENPGCRSLPRVSARWFDERPRPWTPGMNRYGPQSVRWPDRGRVPGQLRRSISVMPSAVKRSSSTDCTSEPFCSRWLLRCACSLSSSCRPMRSVARWKRFDR